MTPKTQPRPTSDLLSDLRRAIEEAPRKRLHVNPESAMWISISVGNTGMSDHVVVVEDPSCNHRGEGWIEDMTADQWRRIRSLVGHRVIVESARIGTVTGTLLELDSRTATVDLGDQDIRYLPWIAIIQP